MSHKLIRDMVMSTKERLEYPVFSLHNANPQKACSEFKWFGISRNFGNSQHIGNLDYDTTAKKSWCLWLCDSEVTHNK